MGSGKTYMKNPGGNKMNVSAKSGYPGETDSRTNNLSSGITHMLAKCQTDLSFMEV